MASAARIEHIAISGAGTGIGRAIALRVAPGRRLSLFARDVGRLERTAQSCRAAGAVSVVVHACDVTDATAVERAFDAFAGAHGELHALVANSGIAGPNVPGRAGEGDRFESLVATNLIGSYRCLRAAQARLASGPSARHLIVIASILARIGVAGYSGYCASKAGLLGLVRSLAVELAPSNVQVNAICPGWVETEMAYQGLDGMAAAMGTDRAGALRQALTQVPLGRMGQPEDVAGVVAFLLSADATGITGQALDINGGAFMH